MDVEFRLSWQSHVAHHVDRCFCAGLAPSLDTLAGAPLVPLAELGSGATLTLAPRRPAQTDFPPPLAVARGDWPERLGPHSVTPRLGRFYPARLLAGHPGLATATGGVVRIVSLGAEAISVDANHPLARHPCTLEASVLARGTEKGGRTARDLAERVFDNGPGMQAPLPEAHTDFFAERPFERADESPDVAFYERPRLVSHLDATALGALRHLHGRFVRPGEHVLDLMASWDSHLPAAADIEVTGVGMNAAELQANPRLARRLVHDLNVAPELPLPAASIDLALCALSVEYLVRPLEAFREVARLLRPGGTFVVAFSERWFPPKAIRLWTELHPFERMGLVLDYFRLSGSFAELHTESLRGHPRPADDRYAHVTPWSDPLFAVWGRRT